MSDHPAHLDLDLSTLPSFIQNASAHKSDGFYTGNVLCSFLLNICSGMNQWASNWTSAEVRGVLMHEEQVWER
jgi:hypothetical protein